MIRYSPSIIAISLIFLSIQLQIREDMALRQNLENHILYLFHSIPSYCDANIEMISPMKKIMKFIVQELRENFPDCLNGAISFGNNCGKNTEAFISTVMDSIMTATDRVQDWKRFKDQNFIKIKRWTFENYPLDKHKNTETIDSEESFMLSNDYNDEILYGNETKDNKKIKINQLNTPNSQIKNNQIRYGNNFQPNGEGNNDLIPLETSLEAFGNENIYQSPIVSLSTTQNSQLKGKKRMLSPKRNLTPTSDSNFTTSSIARKKRKLSVLKKEGNKSQDNILTESRILRYTINFKGKSYLNNDIEGGKNDKGSSHPIGNTMILSDSQPHSNLYT